MGYYRPPIFNAQNLFLPRTPVTELLGLALCFRPDRFELRGFIFVPIMLSYLDHLKVKLSPRGYQNGEWILLGYWTHSWACPIKHQSSCKMGQTNSIVCFSSMLVSEITRHGLCWACEIVEQCPLHVVSGAGGIFRRAELVSDKARGLYCICFKKKNNKTKPRTCSPITCSGIHADVLNKDGWWLPKQADIQNNVDPVICPDFSPDFSELSSDLFTEKNLFALFLTSWIVTRDIIDTALQMLNSRFT